MGPEDRQRPEDLPGDCSVQVEAPLLPRGGGEDLRGREGGTVMLDPRIKTRALKLIREGMSDRKISARLREEGMKMSSGTVYILRRRDRGERNGNHSPHTLEHVQVLSEAGNSIPLIAKKVNRSEVTVRSCLSVLKLPLIVPVEQDLVQTIKSRTAIAGRWGPGRYLLIGDTHIRFHSLETIEQAIALPGQFDGCIFAGDLIDNTMISTFRKTQGVTTRSEFEVANLILDMLVKRFGRVLYILGNHEDRRIKTLLDAAENLIVQSGEKSQFIIDAVNRVREFHTNTRPGVTVHYDWWCELKGSKYSTLICHADGYSAIHGRQAFSVAESLMSKKEEYHIDQIGTVCEAHMHRHVGPFRKWGMYLWELPAACPLLDYMASPKASKSGVDTGYSEMVIKADGSLDFNKSRSYYVES